VGGALYRLSGKKAMSLRPWGVILAGGDGTRLKALSHIISGDNRPKQFCALFGSRSLLARTRGRLAPAISPDRMIYAVVRDHEPFYQPELADVDESRIVVQPSNRGTTTAILYSLLRLNRLEKDPVVAFFPADHHFADEMQFARAVDRAFEVVHKRPELLILLGAPAEHADVEFGWIEPGRLVDGDCNGCMPAFRVNRFWEKPSAPIARDLLGRGCLLNTFVIAGRARTFLEVLESAVPDAVKAFLPVMGARLRKEAGELVAEVYETLPNRDFSHEVLTRYPERLAVIRMDDAGWGDLGTPEGVLAAMQKTARLPQAHAFNSWLTAYRHRLEELCRPPAGKAASADRN
jgi:mannose-1-phosphate guanylyltransferase